MELSEVTVRELHAKIDRERDEKKARLLEELETETRHRHDELDKAWAVFRGLLPVQPADPTPYHLAEEFLVKPVNNTPTINPSPSNGTRKIFRTQQAIFDIVEKELDFDTNIDQPLIYRILFDRHEEIRRRDPASVKGQIPSILNKLVEADVLRQYREGFGQTPAVYRKIKQGEPTNEPAVSAAGPLLPVSEHKEDLPVR